MDLAVDEVDPAELLGRRAPEEADDVFEHQDEGEGEEELEALVAAVDGAEDPLDQRADHREREAAADQHGDEQRRRNPGAERPPDRGDAEVRAERVERPAREVQDLLHAEDELEPRGDEEQDGGVEDAAEDDRDALLDQERAALRPSSR